MRISRIYSKQIIIEQYNTMMDQKFIWQLSQPLVIKFWIFNAPTSPTVKAIPQEFQLINHDISLTNYDFCSYQINFITIFVCKYFEIQSEVNDECFYQWITPVTCVRLEEEEEKQIQQNFVNHQNLNIWNWIICVNPLINTLIRILSGSSRTCGVEMRNSRWWHVMMGKKG